MKEEYKPEQVSLAMMGAIQQVFDRNPLQDNAATRLEVARHLVESVELALNDMTTVCECCGQKGRENFDEWQGREALHAAQTRIMKAGQSIAASKLKAHYGVKTFTELGEL